MKQILAIDPGNVQSAFVWWNGRTIIEHDIVPNAELLAMIRNRFPVTAADVLVIERIASYGMAVGESIFETVYWTGRFAEAWLRIKPEETYRRITRGDIKLHLCQTKRAKDANVRQALIDRLGEPGTKKAPGITHGIAKDQWAALAVAVCAHDRMTAGVL